MNQDSDIDLIWKFLADHEVPVGDLFREALYRVEQRIKDDAAEIQALRGCLRECVDGLECEVLNRSFAELPRRVNRDLEPVRKARALLAAVDQLGTLNNDTSSN